MQIHERIRQVRKEKGFTMIGLHKRLVEIFGAKALRYNTLYRIEKGLRDARVSSLTQVCSGLGVSLKELHQGTDKEIPPFIEIFANKDTFAHYVYSEKAVAQILSSEKQPFLALRIMLQPKGKTRIERDSLELGKFQKWIYGLRGKINCHIGKDTFELKKNDALCFESHLPHYFENTTSKKSSCLIIQNPKHI